MDGHRVAFVIIVTGPTATSPPVGTFSAANTGSTATAVKASKAGITADMCFVITVERGQGKIHATGMFRQRGIRQTGLRAAD